jgi:hypothetical protein
LEPGASDVLTHGLDRSPRCTALRASSPAATITDGFDVFVQEVIAAITTWPWSSSDSVPSAIVSGTLCVARSATCTPPVSAPASAPWSSCVSCSGTVGSLAGNESSSGSSVSSGLGQEAVQRHPERGLASGQRDAVLRALRAGERRHDLAEVELNRLGVGRLLESASCQRPCALA